jgi:hypothetical protein
VIEQFLVGFEDYLRAQLPGGCANPSDGIFFVERFTESLRGTDSFKRELNKYLERSEKFTENVLEYM